ncbi:MULTISPECIES: DUF805 domain-containing protein [unclassified Treponema]|uniref:DUF805 domain-containing protein n=1 Tax=unclassified Treponema TaxID=2638727 RepID=UPI0020A3D2ED|nr:MULTISPECIES: DUF805 domain-containing protein [unclassified Treponema]UTC66757.1 DUF805 domain-containing protein [Treponema sp. OMZ 789]UTC69489.1 DUF805 domain-containing protein [Treponema sp. OMZ 790]UTC72203.1 DUF805 domain-containing protein [Treponema sp. OMZ 791]
MNYYLDVLKKYVVFEGRARRKEYWMFVLFNAVIVLIISILDFVLGTGFLGYLYGLAVFLPSLAVQIRRLHDIDKPWYWIFISFIPLVGPIWMIVLMATEGTKGDNEFGSDPKVGE